MTGKDFVINETAGGEFNSRFSQEAAMGGFKPLYMGWLTLCAQEVYKC